MNPLKLKRYERGLSIAAVALGAGVARTTVAKFEETDELPPAPVARKLAHFYGCGVTDLFPVDDAPAETHNLDPAA